MCCFKFASIITKELKNKGVINSNVKDLRTNGFFLNCYLIMRQTLIVKELTRLVRVSRIWNSFIIKVSKTTVIVKQCRESNIETYRKTLATDLVIFLDSALFTSTFWIASSIQCFFARPASTFFHKNNFKTRSHNTIHIFKNSFVTVFSVFNNKQYPNKPLEDWCGWNSIRKSNSMKKVLV